MKGDQQRSIRLLHSASQVSAASAAAIAFVALLGWSIHLPLLASYGANFIPMAPSTALLFVLFGGAIVLRDHYPQNRAIFFSSLFVGIFGALTALVLFYLSSKEIHPDIEHFAFTPVGSMDNVPLGHVSPLTTFCFILSALSFLLLHFPSEGGRWRTRAAFGLAFLCLLVSLTLLTAYLLGAPLFFGSNTVIVLLNQRLHRSKAVIIACLVAPVDEVLSTSMGLYGIATAVNRPGSTRRCL
jgi:hypothetical protein